MFHRTAALLICVAVLAPAAVLAQDKPISVFFRPSNVQILNNAITAALAPPRFQLVDKIAPDTLVIAIPDKVEAQRGRVSGMTWTFTAVFSRDGDALGHSVESCNEAKLSDCTDQLQSDILTAASIGR